MMLSALKAWRRSAARSRRHGLAAVPLAAFALPFPEDAARATVARLNDDEKTLGRKQLRAQAEQKERLRDEAFEHYHKYEGVVGALQITIVLASVSVVTRIRLLALAAG